ncbi:MAG: hypothetical protein ACE37H_02615 [Phycisphaeraceae bacterium]
MLAAPAGAAFISEIDLDSPAGDAVEVSAIGPGEDYTLVVMDASPFRFSSFGRVMSVAPLSAGVGTNGVALVSDTAWPGGQVPAIPLASLSPTPPTATLNLNFARLVVLMQGIVDLDVFQRPFDQPAGYDPLAVVDWVVMGEGLSASTYANSGYDLSLIGATLGVDVTQRVADTDQASVIGRGAVQGQAIDLSVLHVGEPDTNNQFDAATPAHRYVYTPGYANLALIPDGPDPMPGDTDGDGDIDDADLGTAFAHYSGPIGGVAGMGAAQGDTDGDGDVDDADLGTAFAGYTGPLSPPAVPEPAGVAGLLIGVALVRRGRRV